jgi:hypothetical protein
VIGQLGSWVIEQFETNEALLLFSNYSITNLHNYPIFR